MIRVRGLGKRYERRLPRARSLLGRLRCAVDGSPTNFPVWALKGVDLEVGRGECLGVTGPNGSGKSTLLSILAGIVEPTEGEVRVDGRRSTFLSLNAGIHPDLSARDNVEICGVLMGLSLRGIRARMNAVLDFAELAPQADVRMGELSSGQAARLVFAAVMHSDLDLLLVDEALSVGDKGFQEKCRAAFSRLRAEGKTLVVVSHDDDLLRSLDARIVSLEGGRLRG